MRLVAGKETWELRVYLGRDDEGRVKHLHRRFRGTKREAERALAILVANHGGTLPTPTGEGSEGGHNWGSQTTLNDAIVAWSKNGWEDLSPTTVRHYRELWDRYVRSSIGRRCISKLSPYDVERYFRTLKSTGAGQTTLRHIRQMLHRACRLARKWSGNVLPNPIADTELPAYRLDERRAPVRAPGAEEVRALIAAADRRDERLGGLLRLVAATGVRRGEACALRWSDVSLESGTVRVDESVVAGRGNATVKSPKTTGSIRCVAIDTETLRALVHLRDRQQGLARDCGRELEPDGFVFSYEPGGVLPPHPDTISHAFVTVRRAAGVASDVHVHSLRHFHATAVDGVISEAQKQLRLGWTSVRMARHYTDAVLDEDRRAAEHVGRLLAES